MGTAPQVTAPFTVADDWEVRWNAPLQVNISVIGPDGSVVAGSVSYRGALYVPKGGTYHLQIDYPPLPQATPSASSPTPNPSPAAPPQPWTSRPYDIEVVQMSSALATPAQGRLTVPNYNFPGKGLAGLSGPLPSSTSLSPLPAPGAAPVSWSNPTPAPTPVPTPAPTPAPATPALSLTTDQARAVVLIKGDNAEGTGFLIKTPNGPAIITNIHVLANNPNIKITTNTGAFVSILSQKCAADRDLAMLAVKDDGYSCLEMAPDISKVVQPGDPVITPGNSEGGEVMLNTQGSVLGVGPERVEISNPIYHGNSGGPVFHPKSGKVLGVVTEAEKVDLSDDLDKTSFASRNSAISSQMRYFALRLDTVTEWIAVDARSFSIETQFLDQFEEQSERLDAYLNRSSNNNPDGSSNDKAKIYLNDDKIMRADNNYEGNASGGDTAQHIEALRSLLFDLQGVADLNYDKIQNMNNFYPFDRERAKEEMDYRKALRDELDAIGNNIERLGHLPRTNN